MRTNLRMTLFLSVLLTITTGGKVMAQSEFDNWFEAKSLRIDFILSGNNEQQEASLFQLREEPCWAGPRINLIDPFNYGGYLIRLFDKASGQLIYTRGFNTLFEEWRTTEQAKQERQGWTNSIAVPYPKATITVDILERKKSDMQFHSLMKWDIDPASIFIRRNRLTENRIVEIHHSGNSAEKVDLVFLGEGYSADEQAKFEADAKRFGQSLFEIPPFDQHKNDFNVWAVCTPSEESGTSMSGEGIHKNTAFNSGFYTFGVDRYLTTPDMKAIRDAVWQVPCDAIFILVNSERYGGGGMYNFYAIGTADNERTQMVFVHEFGHSFAGLADEYFSSEVAYDDDFYNTATEPWEPNITTLVDFDRKWRDLLPPTLSIPTPLDDAHKNNLGVFEGAGYKAKGIYRPMDHCMMRDYAPFCPACSRAIKEMIDYFCDREVIPKQ
ncbi:IgA Peptidase M64 [Parabacteroides sp. OttesenSCG-928-N08]|nr:IgA Peptidase M64 [Parabacteroides sp. OttesenSCG-928-N08]